VVDTAVFSKLPNPPAANFLGYRERQSYGLFRTGTYRLHVLEDRDSHPPKRVSCFILTLANVRSRDSSVSIALGYGLDDRASRVRFTGGGGAGYFSLHHCVQNGSGAHPASYQMGTRGSFLGGKAAGA
jgi:hypothetical protein